jgi:formylmethanofuran dehydrogenase subunit E
MPDNAFFVVKPMQLEMPPKAEIEPSEPCAQCGEPTMQTKLETVDGKRLCRDCL